MGEATKRKRKQEVKYGKPYPQNDTYYRIFKNDKTLYRDETGNFKEINNYYYDNVESTFTRRRICAVAAIIFLYWSLFTLFYSISFEIVYWQAAFCFADNYIFLGGITLILFFAFKRKKRYNINDKE